jgi:Fe(3+) dicitrate transport protein
LGGLPFALTGGLRGAWTTTDRTQGRGVDGSAFDMTIVGEPTLDLLFTTTDVSLFTEAVAQVLRDVTITAGLRVQSLTSSAEGTYATAYGASAAQAFQPSAPPVALNESTTETIPLGSLGVSYRRIANVELFANVAQAYRPLFYSQRYPYDFIPVDSSITSSHGIVSELGVRVSSPSWLRTELIGFWIVYGDRTAVVRVNDTLYPNGLRTNAGASEHRGVEANMQALVPMWLDMEWQPFITATYTDARYTEGPVTGKRVENAPEWIVRGGLNVSAGTVRMSATMSYVSAAYSDASNTTYRADGTVGMIPAYALLDASLQWSVAPWCTLTLSANNILNRRYFTTRATTYPGPGLLPGEGTVVMTGMSLTL